jgi:hypothetical protein
MGERQTGRDQKKRTQQSQFAMGGRLDAVDAHDEGEELPEAFDGFDRDGGGRDEANGVEIDRWLRTLDVVERMHGGQGARQVAVVRQQRDGGIVPGHDRESAQRRLRIVQRAFLSQGSGASTDGIVYNRITDKDASNRFASDGRTRQTTVR